MTSYNLTGNCKAEFENWYTNWIFLNKTFLSLKFTDVQILENFKSLHFSEQFGVLQDYFDSVTNSFDEPLIKQIVTGFECFYIENEDDLMQFKTRPEARAEAIKQANKKRNQQLNTNDRL